MKKTLSILLCLIIMGYTSTSLAEIESENQTQILSAHENLTNDNTNAATIYIKACSILTKLPSDFIKKTKDIIKNGWTGNNEELKEILARNQKAINEFKKATKLQYCDFTFGKVIEKTLTSPLPISSKVFEPARLVIIEARLYEKQNKSDLALDNYISILRFASHLNQQKNFSLFSNIEAIIAQNLVYTPLTQYVNRKDLTIQECKMLLDNLIFLRENKTGLEDAFKEEKEMQKKMIRIALDKEKQEGKYKEINEIFIQKAYEEYDRLVDEYFGYLITAFKTNRPEIHSDKINQLEKETKPFDMTGKTLERSLAEITSPSQIAKAWILLGLAQLSSVITKYYVPLSKLNILITATGIKSYELKNGKIPDNLQELMPTYLSKLPEDPFDDFKPLKYKKIDKGWIVYSFGPDRKDNIAAVVFNEEEFPPNYKSPGDIIFNNSSS